MKRNSKSIVKLEQTIHTCAAFSSLEQCQKQCKRKCVQDWNNSYTITYVDGNNSEYLPIKANTNPFFCPLGYEKHNARLNLTAV